MNGYAGVEGDETGFMENPFSILEVWFNSLNSRDSSEVFKEGSNITTFVLVRSLAAM